MEPRFESHLSLQSPGCLPYTSLALRREMLPLKQLAGITGQHGFERQGKAARRGVE